MVFRRGPCWSDETKLRTPGVKSNRVLAVESYRPSQRGESTAPPRASRVRRTRTRQIRSGHWSMPDPLPAGVDIKQAAATGATRAGTEGGHAYMRTAHAALGGCGARVVATPRPRHPFARPRAARAVGRGGCLCLVVGPRPLLACACWGRTGGSPARCARALPAALTTTASEPAVVVCVTCDAQCGAWLDSACEERSRGARRRRRRDGMRRVDGCIARSYRCLLVLPVEVLEISGVPETPAIYRGRSG